MEGKAKVKSTHSSQPLFQDWCTITQESVKYQSVTTKKACLFFFHFTPVAKRQFIRRYHSTGAERNNRRWLCHCVKKKVTTWNLKKQQRRWRRKKRRVTFVPTRHCTVQGGANSFKNSAFNMSLFCSPQDVVKKKSNVAPWPGNKDITFENS